jgi:hypothetical protein
MAFEEGKSGNPGGRPKHKPFQEALRMEMLAAERGEACEAKPGSLRWNARKLLEQGEVSSIREIADRLDGKVAQAVVGDDDLDPIRLIQRIERVVVRPSDPDS